MFGFVFSFHFLTEYQERENVYEFEGRSRHSLVQSHQLVRGVGPMRNYGISFAKTTAMPIEVVKRAEELVAKLVVSNDDEVFYRKQVRDLVFIHHKTIDVVNHGCPVIHFLTIPNFQDSEESPEEVQHINCLRLIQRLKILTEKVTSGKTLNEMKSDFKRLQDQFVEIDDESSEE